MAICAQVKGSVIVKHFARNFLKITLVQSHPSVLSETGILRKMNLYML